MRPILTVLLLTAALLLASVFATQSLFAADLPAAAPSNESREAPESLPEAGLVPLWEPPLPEGAVRRIGWKPFAHPNLPISDLACSPDGKWVASFDAFGTCRGEKHGLIRVWNVPGGRPVRSIFVRPARRHGTSAVSRGLAFSQDACFVAAVVDKEQIGVWSLKSGEQFQCVRNDWDSFGTLALSHDGTVLAASSSQASTVALWNTATGNRRQSLELPVAGCYGLALSPGGRYLAAFQQDRRISLWDTEQGECIAGLGRATEITSGNKMMAFSPDGGKLAVLMGFRAPVACFEVPSGKRLYDAKCEEFPYFENGPVFSADGKYLAAAGWTAVWDAETGEQVWRAPKVNRDADRAVGFLEMGHEMPILITGGDSRYLRFWDFQAGEELFPQPGHRGSLGGRSVALSPDGRLIASCSSGDCRVRLRDANTGELRHEMYPADMPGSVTWSPDGQRLYSTGSTSGGGRGGSYLHIWNPDTGGELVRTQLAGGYPVFSADGKLLALSGGQGILIVDPTTADMLYNLDTGGAASGIVAGFAPDGHRLISQSTGFALKAGATVLWDLLAKKPVWAVDSPPRAAMQPALSTDAAHLAYVSIDEMTMEVVEIGRHKQKRPQVKTGVSLIETATGDVAMKLRRSSDDPDVRGLDFSADGQLLALGDSHGAVTVYDLAENAPVHVLHGHDSPVVYVHWHQSDQRLMSAELGGTILFWDTAPCLEQRTRPELSEAKLAKLWESLADTDAEQALRATLTLCRGGDEVIAYIRNHLARAPQDAPGIAALIRQLDSDRFAERENAAAKLASLGPEAADAMRAAIPTAKSAEVRHRLRSLLARLDVPADRWPELLRQRRAEVVLRRIGTEDAHRLLEQLNGEPGT